MMQEVEAFWTEDPHSHTVSCCRYLPPNARGRLLSYEYHGEDRSYIYHYLWRPVCRRVVNWLPVWLSANVITVTALVLACVFHAVLAYYVPSFMVETADLSVPSPPAIIFIFGALTLVAYQLLDNLDGHQARRTGTSSPLGLLMDHGCDAFNCVVSSLSLAATISAGPCWKTWVLVLNTVVVFFLNTWEEYHRGTLVLPVVNGPNEGILLAVLVYLWTAWVGGPQWWDQKAMELPTTWLPAVLRQAAPQAAVAVETRILQTLCPHMVRNGDDRDGAAFLPFLLNLNCAAAYRVSPPLPVRTRVDASSALATLSVEKQFIGHNAIQNFVLRLYGNNEETVRVRYNTLAVLFMTLLACLTCIGNVYQTYRAIRRVPNPTKRSTGEWLRSRAPFTHALVQFVPLVVVTLMANAWFVSSPGEIFHRHPRVACWTVGLLYTKLTIHLMVAHLCDGTFVPFRRTLLPFIFFGVHICLTYVHGRKQEQRVLMQGRMDEPGGGAWGAASSLANSTTQVLPSSWSTHAIHSMHEGQVPHVGTSSAAFVLDEELILFEFFALSVVTLVHLVWGVVRETAEALDVAIFTVAKERQDALRQRIRKLSRSSPQTF